VLDGLVQIHRGELDLQFAFGNAGQVEEVVDQTSLELNVPSDQGERLAEFSRFNVVRRLEIACGSQGRGSMECVTRG
jgi:hypothetical protein